jgi:hypothetical protein
MRPKSEAGQSLAELAWTELDVYYRLKEPAERLTVRHGLTAPRSAVLRQLGFDGAKTVAPLAKVRATARQAIQRLADTLTADDLTEYRGNPLDPRVPSSCAHDARLGGPREGIDGRGDEF